MRLKPPEKVEKLQTALCTKAKQSLGYRFYVLYDKVYRMDVLHSAYRPGRSAQDAIGQIETLLRSGHMELVDADLSGYFDSIPHSELMKSVARRVVCANV